MTVYYARNFYNVNDHSREVQVGDIFKDSGRSGRYLKVIQVNEGDGRQYYIPNVVVETAFNTIRNPVQRFTYTISRGRRGLLFIEGFFHVKPAPPIPVIRKDYYSGRGLPRYREKEYLHG